MNDHFDIRTQQVIDALTVDTDPYLSCDECFERIDTHVERSVADPAYVDLPMQTHLVGCGVCADEATALRELLTGSVG